MKRFLVAMIGVLCMGLMCAGTTPAGAQPPKMSGPKPATAKTYYVCAKTKTYYTAAAAAKMKYKDAMGNKLTKSATIPKGYKDGSAMKAGSKMGKMDSKSKM